MRTFSLTAGIDAFGVSTLSEALDLAARLNPEIAVLDIGLPEMDGFDLSRALRAMPGGASRRLIALTGYGREQDRAEARAAGFDVFFVKPVEVDALIAAMEQPAAAAEQTH
jgi:CheY-like chemotaxis protein